MNAREPVGSAPEERKDSQSTGSAGSSRSAPDLPALLARIKAAQRKEGTPTASERLSSLDRLERALLDRKDALAEAISRDFGNRSKHETAAAEIFVIQSEVRHARAHLRDWMRPQAREVGLAFLPATAQVVFQPLGVVGIISPWNYPVQLAVAPLVGALAAGNRAMLKPSELVPHTAEALAALIADVFPPEKVTVVTGGPEMGEAFSRLPFDHLVFTGSTRVGKVVMKAAAENLVPVTLELGGKSPVIVGEGISARAAAEKIMSGKCFNAGQTCVAPDYVLVRRPMLADLTAALEAVVAKMYPTLAANPDYTSIINERHYARLRGYIDEAKERGVKTIEINPAKEKLEPAKRKLAPTLLIDPPEDLAVMQEEIFGPVLPIKTYEAIGDAIDYVNDRPRPLALYYLGHDEDETEEVIARTIAGGMCVNETVLHVGVDDLPFGGVGPSGMGHYHGVEGFETFSKKKGILRQSRLSGAPLLRPPFGKPLEILLKLLMGR
jgi:coniferyl-aldehyde dehydrogenase